MTFSRFIRVTRFICVLLGTFASNERFLNRYATLPCGHIDSTLGMRTSSVRDSPNATRPIYASSRLVEPHHCGPDPPPTLSDESTSRASTIDVLESKPHAQFQAYDPFKQMTSVGSTRV